MAAARLASVAAGARAMDQAERPAPLVPDIPECNSHNHRDAQDKRNGKVRHFHIDEIAVDEPADARAKRRDGNQPGQDSQRPV